MPEEQPKVTDDRFLAVGEALHRANHYAGQDLDCLDDLNVACRIRNQAHDDAGRMLDAFPDGWAKVEGRWIQFDEVRSSIVIGGVSMETRQRP